MAFEPTFLLGVIERLRLRQSVNRDQCLNHRRLRKIKPITFQTAPLALPLVALFNRRGGLRQHDSEFSPNTSFKLSRPKMTRVLKPESP